jgi:hypothetical protein
MGVFHQEMQAMTALHYMPGQLSSDRSQAIPLCTIMFAADSTLNTYFCNFN